MRSAEGGWGTPVPAKKSNTKMYLIVGGLMLVLLLGCGFIMTVLTNSDLPEATATATPTLESTPKPIAKPPAIGKAGAKVPEIAEGGHVIGEDAPPGTYRTRGARDELVPLCYWEVRPDGTPDGEIKTQGVIDGKNEQADVKLRKGDYFKTTGCERWVKR